MYTIRLHLLVTPMESRFLSAHSVVAADPLPEALPYGPVQDMKPFLTNFATYARLDPDAEADLSKAAVVLGDAVRAGISATFETQA
jgi:hypothetical protein